MSDTLINGRYRLIAQQGSGGMAVIYRAKDEALGRVVAVKILRPSLTDDPDFLRRFQQEARSVANLSHPNIVTVYDVGSVEGQKTYYIVMEFVEGADLKKLIRTEGALPVDMAVELGIQICAGIGFAHRAGLVHADIKPQNILLTGDNKVKVTDFGIAQVFTEATQPGERASVVWGSPHYFAPEQARGERPTPASDVYSIGIVLFEMLTGRLPYSGANQQELALAHIRDEVPLATDFNPNVPETLARIVHKVMSKDPNQRYRMADQLGHVLLGYRDRGHQNTAPNQRVPNGGNGEPAVPAAATLANQPPVAIPVPPSPSTVPQRPLYNVPPAPAESTLRYSMAPDAPRQPNYAPQPQPAPQQPVAPAGNGSFERGYTGYSRPLPSYTPTEPLWDGVTIALAGLAVLAWVCLLPLYYLVLVRYF